jgi:release factor glutamine methyltransferase
MEFAVGPAVLVPRPETETLIEAALDAFPGRAAVRQVLDLGTGSGCLLCAALREFPNATGLGIDASPAALEIARANAAAHALTARATFTEGDWLAGVGGKFDLVLANPPYIARGEVALLAPELMHEPLAALVAGEDGLGAYRMIVPLLAPVLAADGVAILELGAGQAGPVAALALAAGLEAAALRHDLAGIPRAIVLRAAACLG